MDQSPCIGCRTSFQEGEQLQLQTFGAEYKSFGIPLRDEASKWTILKCILSFLNSQGGTIYLGIDSRKGTVGGMFLERKERDHFKLTTKQLIERIYPKVDLNNKQEVQIKYVPVFREVAFEGKYVVKIVVNQGDPSQVYCISEKVKLVDQNNQSNAKADEFEVFYAYQRGKKGIEELKGMRLMDTIYEKAQVTEKGISVFHQGCNPEPPYIDLQIRTIWLSDISQQTYDILKQGYEDEFDKQNIEFSICYNKDSRTAQICIEDEEDFLTVKQYIQDNLAYLNKLFRDTQEPINFVIKGDKFHYFLIQNQPLKHTPKHQSHKNQPKLSEKPIQFFQPKREPVVVVKEKKIVKPVYNPLKDLTTTTKEPQNVIIFTHIQPQSIQALESFLRNSIYRGYKKEFKHYYNTLSIEFSNEKQLRNFLGQLSHKERQLAGFGFKQELRYGRCLNKIKICNTEKSKTKALKEHLQELMGGSLLETKSQANSLVLSMANREATCQWLDELLNMRDIKKQYCIKGSRQSTPKMKFYIEVDNKLQ